MWEPRQVRDLLEKEMDSKHRNLSDGALCVLVPTTTPTPTPTTTPTPTPTKVVWIRFDTGTSKSVKKLSCSLPSEGLSKAACLPEQ